MKIRTIIEQTIKEQIDKLLLEKPEFATTLYSALRNLKNGCYSRDLVNAIFQKFDKDACDIYDTFCFLQVWSDILLGHILTARIIVFNDPQKNNNVMANNAVLSKLNYPFKAEFIPSQSGEDGYFQWLTPIDLQQEVRDIKDYKGEKAKINHINVPPCRVPLEVGTTSSQKTYDYLYRITGVLARFPYENDKIFIFYNSRFVKNDESNSSSVYSPENKQGQLF